MAFSLTGRPSLGGRSLAKAIAAKEVYSFPVLEADEIADVLREMGAAVTEEDFNKPKPDTFRTWCELFVVEILGINKDALYEAHAAFADALDGNDELHEASVPIVHFIRSMCEGEICAARARARWRGVRAARARPTSRAPSPAPARARPQEQGARRGALRRGALAARPRQARARARAPRALGAH